MQRDVGLEDFGAYESPPLFANTIKGALHTARFIKKQLSAAAGTKLADELIVCVSSNCCLIPPTPCDAFFF